MPSEIISTVERRRHWPDEEKLRIIFGNIASDDIKSIAGRLMAIERQAADAKSVRN